MINIDDRLLEQCDESEFKLLCHIAKRVGEDKTAFPSNATLCADTGWHIEKMRAVKKRLVQKGFLKEAPRMDAEGRQTSNLITIVTPFLSVYINLNGAGGVVEAEQMPHELEVLSPTENPGAIRIFRTGGGVGKSIPTPVGKSAPTPLRKIHTLSINHKEVLTSEVLTPSPPASEREAAAVEAEKKSDGPGFAPFEEIFEEKKFAAAPAFAQPTQVAPSDGPGAAMLAAVADAQAWCAAHPDQVRQWCDIAKWRDDLAGPIAGFFSHWWGENGTQHRCRSQPQDFFQTRFLKWLQGEARIQQQQSTNQQNHGHSTARGGYAANRKPARANGAEDAVSIDSIAAVLEKRHGVKVDFHRG